MPWKARLSGIGTLIEHHFSATSDPELLPGEWATDVGPSAQDFGQEPRGTFWWPPGLPGLHLHHVWPSGTPAEARVTTRYFLEEARLHLKDDLTLQLSADQPGQGKTGLPSLPSSLPLRC